VIRRVILLVALSGCEKILDIHEARDLELSRLDLHLGPPSNQFVVLTPPFDPAVTTYSASISPIDKVTVNASCDDPEVQLRIGTTAMRGTLNASVDLSLGATKVIDVQASIEDGFAVDYRINVTVGGADFEEPVNTVLSMVRSMATGDLDGDGVADLAVLHLGGLQILRGRATGFDASTPPTPLTSLSCFAVASGDFHDDAHQDVALACNDQAAIFVGTGSAQLSAPALVPLGGAGFNSLAVGELTGDLRDDLAVVAEASGTLRVFQSVGPGVGTLQDPITTPPVGPGPRSIAIGPLDTVAGNDVVVLNPMAMLVFKNDSLNVAPASLGIPNSNGMVALGDFDGTGGLDYALIDDGPIGRLAVVTSFFPSAETNVIDLANNPHPIAVAVADLDADGRDDIVVATSAGPDVFFAGPGGLKEFPFTFPTNPPPKALVIGDFTGDGRLDLAIGTDTGVLLYRGKQAP